MTIDLGKKREVFWDDYLVDTEKTTAFHRLMEPEKKEVVFTFDKGYENLGISYPLIVKVDDTYRMYYTRLFIPWQGFFLPTGRFPVL